MLKILTKSLFLLAPVFLTGLHAHGEQYSNRFFDSSVRLGVLANSGRQVPYDLGPNKLFTTEGAAFVLVLIR